MLPPAEDLDRAAHILASSRRLCVFTGAGISAESGIATFRDQGGFWEKYPVDEFASPGGLAKVAFSSPERFAAFLLDVIGPMAAAAPNAGHAAIAALAEDHRHVTVVTQNVDGLHQRAGSEPVWEVHGSLFQIVDRGGQPVRRLSVADMTRIVRRLKRVRSSRWLGVPQLVRALRPFLGLSLAGIEHRPNVVLFGEALAEPAWTRAQEAAWRADAMLMVGTSGTVYPANLLPGLTQERGGAIVGVGPVEETEADVWLTGTAAETLPALLERLRR